MTPKRTYIGIDAGGTLIKVASLHDGTLIFEKYPASQLGDVAAWSDEFDNAKVRVTGGGAQKLNALLKGKAEEIVEFEATCIGVQFLLKKYGISEQAYIITNVGTGTSIHVVENGNQHRIGGTGVGGGTLLGLSRLLTGITDYDTIVRTAANGSRERIDLKVKHIYEGAEPPIPGDLTASNFGSIMRSMSDPTFSNEELLASVVGLVGETAATASVLAAGHRGVSSIVYIGSSFVRNELLKEVVQGYTKLRGASPIFLNQGEYCGALVALLSTGANP